MCRTSNGQFGELLFCGRAEHSCEPVVREGAAPHLHVAEPDLLLTEIDRQPPLRVLDRRDGVARALALAGAAVQADFARVEDGVRLQLAVGENKPQPHARPELLGQKDLGEPDLAQPAARGDDADAAHDVGRHLIRRDRLARGAVALGYGRIVGDGLPAVVLDEATEVVRLLRAEKRIELVIGIKRVVVPVRALLDAAVGAARDAHRDRDDRPRLGKIGQRRHQLRRAPKALYVPDGDAVDAQLGRFGLDHLRRQFHFAPRFPSLLNTPPSTLATSGLRSA